MKQNRVFLSFASKDGKYAKRIAKELTEAGADVWYEESDIKSGGLFGKETEKALESSTVFVAIVSDNYMNSRWTDMELGAALVLNKEIIPLVIEDGVKLPTGLTSSVKINALDMNVQGISKRILSKLNKIES